MKPCKLATLKLVLKLDREKSYFIVHTYLSYAYLLLGEYVIIVTDFGGRVEELYLASQTTGMLRDVLVSHNGDSSAIKENTWSKGMLLLPYANRIAYVRTKLTFKKIILCSIFILHS